jgi:hypothetical protein
MLRRRHGRTKGQALVEFALVLPIALMVLVGIIALGIGVFYQQEVTNAAREAARYASVHSATAQCPTTSTLDPRPGMTDPNSGRTSTGLAPESYYPCDTPAAGWPDMTASARSKIFGLPVNDVQIVACWSGYVTDSQYDAPPTSLDPNAQPTQCLISGVDPAAAPHACNPDDPTQTGCIPCTASLRSSIVDTGSDISEGPGRVVANTVTAYACYVWTPPLAGFLLVPKHVVLQAVITEPMEHQQ